MRVFIYEYTCARPADGRLTRSVRREGSAMLGALLADFARVPGVRVVTLVGPGVTTVANRRVRVVTSTTEAPAFRALAESCDLTLLVAPEFDNLLASRADSVLRGGGRLLGPSPEAVRLTADKLALARHLRRGGVPTPACRLVAEAPPGGAFPVVYKPRDGAGSVATFLVRSAAEWHAVRRMAAAEGWKGESVIQPFAPGRPASVSFLIGPGATLAMPACAQHVSADGRFRYRGGALPLPDRFARRATSLALRAVQAVPGLRGYVGVDLVLGDAGDGSADRVIEINPRVTTSYVGLRALCRSNLAAAMIACVHGDATRLSWKAGSVSFRPDGRVRFTRRPGVPTAAAPWRKTP